MNESREVPPPAEEAGVAETHRAGPAVGFEFRLGPPGGFDYSNDDDGRLDNVQEAPGMEVDLVDDSGDDFRELMRVLTRDECEQVRRANSEIMSVVRSLGGNDRRFRREIESDQGGSVGYLFASPSDSEHEVASGAQVDTGLCARPDHQGR